MKTNNINYWKNQSLFYLVVTEDAAFRFVIDKGIKRNKNQQYKQLKKSKV